METSSGNSNIYNIDLQSFTDDGGQTRFELTFDEEATGDTVSVTLSKQNVDELTSLLISRNP